MTNPSAPAVIPPTTGAIAKALKITLLVVGVLILVGIARAAFHTDPDKAMTKDLYAIAEAESRYHAAHNAFTADQSALAKEGKLPKLHSTVLAFEAGRNGYQATLRRNDSDDQCRVVYGSFKALGGSAPDVSCAASPARP